MATILERLSAHLEVMRDHPLTTRRYYKRVRINPAKRGAIMPDRSCRFAAIGDNCIDRYLPLNQAAVGGNAVNVAVQLALLGQDCGYFGAVGCVAGGTC